MQVGERLLVRDRDGSHPCSIRYVGPIGGKPGEWVGVEWDHASRGKNDGSVAGTRYFECLHSANAGSFLKHDKVKAGASLLDAVSERYTLAEADLKDMSIQAGRRTMAVDFAGMQQMSQRLKSLNLLTSMTMHDAHIARAGDMAALAQVAQRLEHLCLSANLFGSWPHVHPIAHHLSSLRVLNLSGNRLQRAADLAALPPCAHVHTLVLNGCALSWQDAVHVGRCMRGLKELYMGENDVAALNCLESDSELAAAFPELRVLDLTDNALPGWAATRPLAALPQLTELKLSGNSLRAVGAPGEALGGLRSLLLAGCEISDWASVDHLAALSALTNLRLSGNPVLHFSSMGGRFECVARVPSLRHLNGADVSPHERRDCELRYLRYAMQRIVDLGAGGAAEAARHPQLAALKARHGEPDIVATSAVDAQHSTLDEQLLAVDLICPDAPNGAPARQRVRVPPSTTIGLLKLLCAAVYGVDASAARLTVHSGPRAGEDLGADNTLDVAYWDLARGDVVGVAARPPAEVWAELSGSTAVATPEHWILPPEFRPELAGLGQ